MNALKIKSLMVVVLGIIAVLLLAHYLNFHKHSSSTIVEAIGSTFNRADIHDNDVMDNNACCQIMANIPQASMVSVVPANAQGQCTQGDFCAKATGNDTCVYLYRGSNEKIVYNAKTGQVSYPRKTFL